MTRVFTNMEIWVEVRRRVLTGELSKRAACREYKIPVATSDNFQHLGPDSLGPVRLRRSHWTLQHVAQTVGSIR